MKQIKISCLVQLVLLTVITRINHPNISIWKSVLISVVALIVAIVIYKCILQKLVHKIVDKL